MILLNEKNKGCSPKVFYVEKLGNMNAFTIPPIGIFIVEKHRHNAALLQHELIHWRQYRRQGIIKFLLGYLKEHIQRGYDGNRYEIEARYCENEYVKRNYTEAVRP